MVEQAAFDRNLFQSSRKNATVELRFPEIFNTGSPYNHIAGHSGGDLTTLIEHYEKQNRDEEERKVRAQQEEGERE
ncbi:MAG: hypothetical protein M1838_002495 [Thelocarpon superellum]|nr:MAG: hypothetical protein M1838_002495 [Thelocarpon superellum]